MPMSEEERRRRCIIDPSSCPVGMTPESALAEELGEVINKVFNAGERAPGDGEGTVVARHILANYALVPKNFAESESELSAPVWPDNGEDKDD